LAPAGCAQPTAEGNVDGLRRAVAILSEARFADIIVQAESFEDDFDDGDYTGWDATGGSWTASSYYLDATADWSNVTKAQTQDDMVTWASYYVSDTTDPTTRGYIEFRYTDNNNRACVRIYPGQLELGLCRFSGNWTPADFRKRLQSVVAAGFLLRFLRHRGSINPMGAWRGTRPQLRAPSPSPSS